MTYKRAIEWLLSIKYDDTRELAEYQKIFNGNIDEVIKLLSLHLEKPDKVEGNECPGGVCGTGGRE